MMMMMMVLNEEYQIITNNEHGKPWKEHWWNVSSTVKESPWRGETHKSLNQGCTFLVKT
jgi:hypothetical protein